MTEDWKERSLSKPIIELSIIFLWLVCNSHFFPPGGNFVLLTLWYFVFSVGIAHTLGHFQTLFFLGEKAETPSQTLCFQQILSWGWAETGHKKTSKVVERYPQAWHWRQIFNCSTNKPTQSCCLLAPGTVSTLSWLGHHLLIPVLHTEPLAREVAGNWSFRYSWASRWLYVSREGGNVSVEGSPNGVGLTASYESGCQRAPTSATASVSSWTGPLPGIYC